MHLSAGGQVQVTADGLVTATTGDIVVDAGSLDMLTGAKMLATVGDVEITTADDATLAKVTAGGHLELDAGGDAFALGALQAEDYIDLSADGRLVIGASGSATTTTGNITLDADSLKMVNGSILLATAGDVGITTTLDALVTDITSGSADADAVTVIAGAHVLGGTATNRIDITADATATSGVKIIAGAGIGDETEADAKYVDGTGDVPGSANAITDIANPLRLKTANLDLTATTGDIDIETLIAVTSATLDALTGNIDVTADADFHANLINAPDGLVTIDANGNLVIDKLTARAVAFDSAGELDLPDLEIAQSASLAAGVLHVNITQVPPSNIPLDLTLTGHHGGVGTFADVFVDAASGVNVDSLRFVDSVLGTSGGHVSVASAFVPGSLRITSPFQTLFFNDRSPTPTPDSDVQLYQPNFAFSVLLNDFRTISDAYVVQYQIGAQVTDILDGVAYDGASLVRDSVRIFRNGDATLDEAFSLDS